MSPPRIRRGPFTNDERILAFRNLIAVLKDRRFLQATNKKKFTLQLVGGPHPIEGLDPDHLDAFLGTFRQLLLQQDAVYFPAVSLAVQCDCGRSDLGSWALHAESVWTGSLSHPGSISVNGGTRTTGDLLDLFIYGGVAHSDLEKVAELDGLGAEFRAVLRLQLISGLKPLLASLGLMDKVIWHWRDAPGEPVPAPPPPWTP